MAVERVSIDYVESRSNLYKVPEKQWRKWGAGPRQVFNEVYSSMRRSRDLYLHPAAPKASREQWKTTCWNAAWIAADAAKRATPDGRTKAL